MSRIHPPATAIPSGSAPKIADGKSRLIQSAENHAMSAVGELAAVMNRLFGRRETRPLGIITWHRVCPRIAGLPFPEHNVEPSVFRGQIEGLLSKGFQPVSLHDVLSSGGRNVVERSFAVTFDDGFETVYTDAWQVLRELGVPATIFVSTAYLDSERPFPFDAWGIAHAERAPAESYRPLTTRQCRELAASGLVEIGAHTHTHSDFRGRPREFRDDLALSIEIVRERFGGESIKFAFPWGGTHNGFAGDDLAAAARESGVVCGLTTEPVAVDPSTDPFQWGRYNAFWWDSAATLAAKLNGWYSWAPKLRKRLGARLRPQNRAAGNTPAPAAN